MPFASYPKKAHATGQARIRVAGHDRYLGLFGSPESHAEYARLKAEWEAGQIVSAPPAIAGLTVTDAVALFLSQSRDHCLRHEDGTPKKELGLCAHAFRPLLKLYAATAIAAFRVAQLETVRAEMLRRGWCKRVANKGVVRIRQMVRWLEQQEMVPEGRWNHLRTLKGLRLGNVAVPPAPEADLAAALAEMRPVVRGIVEVLLWTGARPTEVLTLRRGDIVQGGRVELERGVFLDLGERVWAAVIQHHKTEYAGHGRVLFFGPRAQAALAPFLARKPAAYLFRPAEALRIDTRGKRKVGERYRIDSLGHAIAAGCERAGVPRFTAYQLRHNAATRLASEFSPDVARIVLGHHSLSVTRSYVADDVQKAVDAMRKSG